MLTKPKHIKCELPNQAVVYVPPTIKAERWGYVSNVVSRLVQYEKFNTLVSYVAYCTKCLQEVPYGLGYSINRCRCPKNTRSKYHNKKIRMGQNVFDSKAEARRFVALSTAHVTEELIELELQPTFNIPAAVYRADFAYKIYDHEDKQIKVVEDVKGVRTAEYNLKRKLFLITYPDILFIEVGATAKASTWRNYKPKRKLWK